MESLLQSLLENYTRSWFEREREMLRRWDFYAGNHTKYLPRFEAETMIEWERRIAGAVIENHCKPTVNISAGYLYGMAEKISRRCRDESAQSKIEEVWEKNDFDDFLMDVSIMAGVTGFAVVYARWVDRDTLHDFPPTASTQDKSRGIVRYVLLDSSETLPIPRDDDPRLLKAVLRYSLKQTGSGLPIYDRLRGTTYDTYHLLEYTDDTVWSQWEERGSTYVPIFSSPNLYRDVSIPFVVFSNPGDPMYLEGDPDHIDVIPLNLELDERLTDDANTISHHSFPILVHDGDLPNFVRKPNSHIQGDPGKMKYLTWDNVLDASQKHETELRRNIPLTSSISDLSRGRSADIGQVRSGAGLRSMFQADILHTRRKQKRAIRFEQALFRSSLKLIEYYTSQQFSSYRLDLVFHEDFIGLDELLKAQAEQLEVTTGTVSLKDILLKNYPNLTDAEITQKLSEIQTYNDWHKVSGNGNVHAPSIQTNIQSSYDQMVPR